jgi:hypothetical protein
VEIYLHSPNTSSWRGAQSSTGTTLALPLPLPFIVGIIVIFMCLMTRSLKELKPYKGDCVHDSVCRHVLSQTV